MRGVGSPLDLAGDAALKTRNDVEHCGVVRVGGRIHVHGACHRNARSHQYSRRRLPPVTSRDPSRVAVDARDVQPGRETRNVDKLKEVWNGRGMGRAKRGRTLLSWILQCHDRSACSPSCAGCARLDSEKTPGRKHVRSACVSNFRCVIANSTRALVGPPARQRWLRASRLRT